MKISPGKYNQSLILNPLFLSGLILLVVNDAILKWQYSNAITGKLSDFAGLFIFPIFLAYVFPRIKKYIVPVIAVVFILWKSSLSSPFINWLNSLSFLQFNRVIDYTDLLALVVLPFSHLMINETKFVLDYKHTISKYASLLILLMACFAFMATSMTRYEMPKGTIYLGKSYKVKMSQDSLLTRITELGYEWTYHQDTISNKDYYNEFGYYQIKDVLVIEDEIVIDTLKSVKFALRPLKENKTKIELINIELSRPGQIQDWKYLRSLSRFYKHQMKKSLIEPIKD